jgi:hypothetical protein
MIQLETLPRFPCLSRPGTREHKKPLTKHGFKDACLVRKGGDKDWGLVGVPTGGGLTLTFLISIRKGLAGTTETTTLFR